MHLVIKSYRGLSFLLWLNADRIFMLGTVILGLLAGAFLGAALVGI